MYYLEGNKNNKLRDLDEKLELLIDDFRYNMQSWCDSADKEHTTKHDLEEISRQAFYVMDGFHKNIIKYLKETC